MRVAIYSHSIAPSIDGVCRRFTGLLHEMDKQGHETLLFTLEDFPLNLPSSTRVVTVDHMFFPSYPDKKVARVTWRTIATVYRALLKFNPDVSVSSLCFSVYKFSFLCSSVHNDIGIAYCVRWYVTGLRILRVSLEYPRRGHLPH